MFRPTSTRTLCAVASLPIRWMRRAGCRRKRVRRAAVARGAIRRTAAIVLVLHIATGAAAERAVAGGAYSNLGPWSREQTRTVPQSPRDGIAPRVGTCGGARARRSSPDMPAACPDRHVRAPGSIRHAPQ